MQLKFYLSVNDMVDFESSSHLQDLLMVYIWLFNAICSNNNTSNSKNDLKKGELSTKCNQTPWKAQAERKIYCKGNLLKGKATIVLTLTNTVITIKIILTTFAKSPTGSTAQITYNWNSNTVCLELWISLENLRPVLQS